MPHLSSNIPSTISSWSIFSELLRMTRCSLKTKNFIPRASDLLSKMIVQYGNRATLTKQLKTVFHRYQIFFKKYGKTHEEINISIMKNS